MVTVTVVSDLHLEARPLELHEVLEPGHSADVLCLLGDIGDPASPAYRDFIAAVAGRFPTVLLLAGNNEYRNRAPPHGHSHHHGHHSHGHGHHRHHHHGHAHGHHHGRQHGGGAGTSVSSSGSGFSGGASTGSRNLLAGGQRAAAAASVGGGGGGGGGSGGGDVGRSMAQTEELIRAVAGSHPNVHFLQNDTHVVGHVAFIGATLWSYIPDDPLPLPDVGQDAGGTLQSIGNRASGGGGGDGGGGGGAAGRTTEPETTGSVGGAAAPAKGAAATEGAAVAAVARGERPPHPAPGASAPPEGPAALRPGADLAAVRQDRASGGEREGSGGGAAPRPPLAPPVASAAAAAAASGGSPFFSGGFSCLSQKTPPLPVANSLRAGGTSASASAAPAAKVNLAQSLPVPRYGRCSAGSAVGMSGGGDACDTCSGAATGGGGGMSPCVRRRLKLRHSVSLSSLPIDAPCPPLFVWREPSSSTSSGASGSRGSSGSGSDSEGSGSESSSGGDSSTSSGSGGGSDTDSGDGGGSVTESDNEVDFGPSSEPMALRGAAAAAHVMAAAPQLASLQLRSLSEAPVTTPLLTGSSHAARPGPVAAAAATAAAPAVAATTQPVTLSTALHQHHSHHHHRRRVSSSSASAAAAAATAAAEAGPSPPATVRDYIAATSLDYRRILAVPGGPPITPDTTNALFASSLAYLRSAAAAAAAAGLVPVVLTHHAPSLRGTSHPRFGGHPSTHAYGTDLEPFLRRSCVAAWYCGHTHYNFDMTLPGNVRLSSNQFGSQQQPGQGYSRSFRHTLPGPPPRRGGADAAPTQLPRLSPSHHREPESEAAVSALQLPRLSHPDAAVPTQPLLPSHHHLEPEPEPEEGASAAATAAAAPAAGGRDAHRAPSFWLSAAAAGRSAAAAGLAPAGPGCMGVEC